MLRREDERAGSNANPPLRVLGVDPGTARTGWGVIEKRKQTITFCAGGVISLKGFHALPERLRMIYAELGEIIHTCRPQVLSLEKAFVAYNVQSAFRLGEARGVVLLAAAQAGLYIAEYNPTEIKTAVVGYGRADKNQVQQTVFALLGGGPKSLHPIALPVSQDATDALAAALCHLQTSSLADQLRQAGEDPIRLHAAVRRGRSRSLRNVLTKKTEASLLAAELKAGR